MIRAETDLAQGGIPIQLIVPAAVLPHMGRVPPRENASKLIA
ncbi:hypothetical protein ACQPYK_22735 [Streptosporangium sp. CA-135522]